MPPSEVAVELLSLWMPVLISAVIIFVASAIIHMGPLWHKGDYPKLPDENRFMEAVRPMNIPPGDYMVPRCSGGADMKSPEFAEKLEKGPIMIMTVMPNGQWSMGRPLFLWFIYCVIVGVFAAYIASLALPKGAHYLKVFQIVGAVGFAGFWLALLQMWIWYRRSGLITFKYFFDGLLYACLMAGTFGWLWPK